ncbi:MAG: hypothetical protein LC778_16420 [Acidobacteria bacterium]|nr:hypothetical protein [Acidobacteriota bacterium]
MRDYNNAASNNSMDVRAKHGRSFFASLLGVLPHVISAVRFLSVSGDDVVKLR